MSVNTLHIEASSFCNARCPGCPRNAYGYPLEGFYDERNLKIDQLKEILSQFTDVYHILYCGNHGDPMMNPDIAELCDFDDKYVEVATNGGIGRLETYKKLAEQNTRIIFGIDGLRDTNHLYRQGVKWDNLMERVKTFISAGGKATWQFIRFQHNMEQTEQAKKLSEDLGFDHFFTMDVGRNNMPAIQSDKTISHWILPPNKDAKPQDFDVDAYLEMRYNPINLNKKKYKVGEISCEHVNGSVYVNSSGDLFPCCYHGFGHVDRPKVKLDEFHRLKESWKTNDCDETCALHCGKNVN